MITIDFFLMHYLCHITKIKKKSINHCTSITNFIFLKGSHFVLEEVTVDNIILAFWTFLKGIRLVLQWTHFPFTVKCSWINALLVLFLHASTFLMWKSCSMVSVYKIKTSVRKILHVSSRNQKNKTLTNTRLTVDFG